MKLTILTNRQVYSRGWRSITIIQFIIECACTAYFYAQDNYALESLQRLYWYIVRSTRSTHVRSIINRIITNYCLISVTCIKMLARSRQSNNYTGFFYLCWMITITKKKGWKRKSNNWVLVIKMLKPPCCLLSFPVPPFSKVILVPMIWNTLVKKFSISSDKFSDKPKQFIFQKQYSSAAAVDNSLSQTWLLILDI